jgi:hypothetical protein
MFDKEIENVTNKIRNSGANADFMGWMRHKR